MSEPNPWFPETDPMNLRVLGKAAEEVSELGSAIARCVIQGIDEAEPVTGKVNRQWLSEEVADVEAQLEMLKEHFGLDRQRIRGRVALKLDFMKRWLRQVSELAHAFR